MELNHFGGAGFGNGVLPVEIVAIGSDPGFTPPRLTFQNSSFENNLYTVPVVAVGGDPGLNPPR